VDLKGRSKTQIKAFAQIGVAFQLATVAIYIILAWVFASYTTPLVVMSIIPFGFVGAIIGHYIFGFNLSYLGMMGLMGLFGVMVNDSIILVFAIRKRVDAGESLEDAVVGGTCDRLRPVVLTTITTIAALTPVVYELDVAAQFYKPLAVTLAFGLLVSTVVVLTWIPALLGVGDDIRRKRIRRSAPAALA
jgi:multidrug efflux pump subunit AcrB